MFRQFVKVLMAQRGRVQRWLEQVCWWHAHHYIETSKRPKQTAGRSVFQHACVCVCVCVCGNLSDYNLEREKNPEAVSSGILWHFHAGEIRGRSSLCWLNIPKLQSEANTQHIEESLDHDRFIAGLCMMFSLFVLINFL